MTKKKKTKSETPKNSTTTKPPKPKNKGLPERTKDGMVVIPTKTESQPIFMGEQVDILEQTKKAVKEITKPKLMELLGKRVTDVQSQLEEMVSTGEIGSFRIVKSGQLFTNEFDSSRVQVFETSGVIKEIEVG